MVDSFLVLHLRNEDHFGITLPYLFQSLEVSDLHRRFGVEFFGSQPH